MLSRKEIDASIFCSSCTTIWQSNSIISLGMPRGKQSYSPLIMARLSIVSRRWITLSFMLAANKTSSLMSLGKKPKSIACKSSNSAPLVFNLKEPIFKSCKQPMKSNFDTVAWLHSEKIDWWDRAHSNATFECVWEYSHSHLFLLPQIL